MQTTQGIATTDAALAMAFIEATKPFSGQAGKNNPELQAVVKQYGTPIVQRLKAQGDSLADAVHHLRVLLALNEIK